MRIPFRTVLALAAGMAVAACGRNSDRAKPAGPLDVREAWARAADSGATGGVYLTLANTDTADLAITSLSTPAARSAELHETMQHEGMAHMVARPAMPIRRDSILAMAPGGLHVMLMDLTRALKAGDTVVLTLTLADGRTVPVTATVRSP